jgi:ATP-dependent exoDNAse (exonuclease V) alpha subunit
VNALIPVLMERISNYFDFPLRNRQEKAFIALTQFITNTGTKAFVLKGYAGTGKTTLMGGLIKWMAEEEISFSLLASTGRAAKILSNLTDNESHTIHSQIYIFKDLSEDLEEVSKLQENLKVDDKGQISLMFDLRTIQSNIEKVYIVDEASMVADIPDKSGSFARYGSGELLNDLLKYDVNGKFIFVGDPCQLPPINQNFSPALSPEYLKQKYRINVEEFELTEIVRQSNNNGIIEASLKLRNLYQTNPDVRFGSLTVKGYNNISLHVSHASLLQSYIEKLKSKDFEYSTLLCQTNRHCSDLNKIIRS